MAKVAWRPLVLALAAALFGQGFARSQSTIPGDLGPAKLLVSAKGLPDPNFSKTVVLLIQYDQRGAVGLVINRRSEVPVSRVLEGLPRAKRASDPVYIGGPVELDSVLALVRSPKKVDDTTAVMSGVYLVSTKAPLEEAVAEGEAASELRVYLGYCGWDAGQLENEVRQGGWWIFQSDASLIFDSNPGSLWGRLIARTEQQIAEANPEPSKGLAGRP